MGRGEEKEAAHDLLKSGRYLRTFYSPTSLLSILN